MIEIEGNLYESGFNHNGRYFDCIVKLIMDSKECGADGVIVRVVSIRNDDNQPLPERYAVGEDVYIHEGALTALTDPIDILKEML